jgi:hypothetical protein
MDPSDADFWRARNLSWRSVRVSEFERRRPITIRDEFDQEHKAQIGPATALSNETTAERIFRNART